MQDLWSALAIVLVLEGIMPFISPKGWKEAITKICELPDAKLRQFGLGIMLTGAVLLTLIR